MIPLRLEITNMGAVPYADHDLRNIGLAVVAGPNGVGKSTTFTVAPTWCLFGSTKNGCSVDDMIQTGQTEMSCVLEFEHRAEVYRVTRTRSKKTKTGKSTLELFRMDNGNWEPIGGTTIAETQAKIKELVGLDAETFTASSMILQGKANEFTSKQPAHRKAVLQDILGLYIYDWLQEQAKKKLAAKTTELEQMKGRLAELEKQAGPASLEDIELHIKATQDAVTQTEADIEKIEKLIQEAEAQKAQIEVKQIRISDLEDQAGQAEREAAERILAQNEENTAITRAEKILEEAERIREKASQYEQVQRLVAGLDDKRAMLRTTESEYKAARSTNIIQQEKADRLDPQIAELQKLLEQRGQLEADAKEYRHADESLHVLDKLAEEYAAQDAKLRKAQDAYGTTERDTDAQIREIEWAVNHLQDKVTMMENANCVDPENATCRFLADAQEAKRQLPDKQSELDQYRTKTSLTLSDMKEAVNQALEARAAIGYDPQEHNEVKVKIRDLRPSVEKLAQLDTKAELLGTLHNQKKEHLQAATEAEQLYQEKFRAFEKLQAEIAALETEAARLPNLKRWADLLPELANAENAINAAKQRITTLQTEIDIRKAQVEEKRRQAETIREELKKLEEEQITDRMRETLRLKREALKEHQVKGGRLQAELEKVRTNKEEQSTLRTEMAPVAKEIVRWQTLVRAFSRDGVPAMIIENAVPELESITNEILGQMTRGRNSLFFNTQREKKDGKGIIETLDIMITDWNCPQGRAYETFSGGEQLRIDFALRFALSELLARRAGSRVEWLTIDEGLGSQDGEHRTLVLEAIKNVASRFKKVLVITHIEEAQAVFEQQIVFEPELNQAQPQVA